jgi:hypothetical protein
MFIIILPFLCMSLARVGREGGEELEGESEKIISFDVAKNKFPLSGTSESVSCSQAVKLTAGKW